MDGEKFVAVLGGVVAVDAEAVEARLRVRAPTLGSVTVVRRVLDRTITPTDDGAGDHGGTGDGEQATLVELWVSAGTGDALGPDTTAALADDLGWPPIRRVSETVLRPPSDATGPGVLAVGLLRRNPATTRTEFGAHWNDVHAPMVIEAGPLFDAYVTNVAVDDIDGWDGLVEQWYRDAETFARHGAETRARKPHVVADMARMLSGVDVFLTPDRHWPV